MPQAPSLRSPSRRLRSAAKAALFVTALSVIGALAAPAVAAKSSYWYSTGGNPSASQNTPPPGAPPSDSRDTGSSSSASKGATTVRQGRSWYGYYSGGNTGRTPGANPGGGTEPGTNPPPQAGPLPAEEQRMLQLINEARVARGLRPVAHDPVLTDIARRKAWDILAKDYWGHNSPTYGSPADMARAAGLQFSWVGENLAKTWSVEQAFEAFMNSTAHRNNILYPSHTRAGVGIVPYEKWGRRWLLVVVELLSPPW